PKALGDRLDNLNGRWKHLAADPRIANVVSAFPEKAWSSVVHVKACTHPVAFLRRGGHAQIVREREASDPHECVGDDLRFDFELTRICDMRVAAAAAARIAERFAPIA